MSKTAKANLLSQICTHLETELVGLERSAQAAADAATHEESKPENKYDTRGLEASYLAGAQRERIAEVHAALQVLRSTVPRLFQEGEAIGPTAIVELDQAGSRSLCFIMLVGAGYPLSLDGQSVVTVTTQAPLGRALIGKQAGDIVTVKSAQGARDYEIVGVW